VLTKGKFKRTVTKNAVPTLKNNYIQLGQVIVHAFRLNKYVNVFTGYKIPSDWLTLQINTMVYGGMKRMTILEGI
jgi:hypothetical protein